MRSFELVVLVKMAALDAARLLMIGTTLATPPTVLIMSSLAASSAAILTKTTSSNERMEEMLAFLPRQTAMLEEVQQALVRVDTLGREVSALRGTTGALRDEVKQQSVVVKRMDTTLWNSEKESLRDALAAPSSAAVSAKP